MFYWTWYYSKFKSQEATTEQINDGGMDERYNYSRCHKTCYSRLVVLRRRGGKGALRTAHPIS